MKKKFFTISLSVAFLAGFISCSAQKIPPGTEIETEKDGKMLLGNHKVLKFAILPYSNWFSPEYNSYKTDAKSIEELKKSNFNAYQLTVFVGTWCEDSHREFPRLMKILDEIGYPSENLNIIALDRDKKSPNKEEINQNIERVPTIILSKKFDNKGNIIKDIKELGRIVEFPESGWLERDLLKIINQK